MSSSAARTSTSGSRLVGGLVGGGEAPECTACGACCFSELVDYVRVFEIDLDRMDARARGYVEEREGRRAMRMSGGRCAALVIDPVRRSFECAIYPMRPDVCHSLARGSSACAADRTLKAELPLLAVESLLRRG